MSEYEKLRGIRLKMLDRIADDIAAKAAARGMTDEVFQDLMSDVS